MSFTINSHEKTNRVQVINIKGEDLDRLIFPFQKHSITSLEYKPFSRFTLAKSLDEVFENKLGKALVKILNDRETGTIIIEPEVSNKKFDKDFLVKLSTGFAYLVGNPNFDSMTDKYYARFYVKHQDASDSYLRKAYTNLDLHTDGTYVKEKTDWLIMTKMEEQGVSGGESVILHLDDWEHLDELSKNPVGQQDFIWGSPKSKNVEYKVEHPVFKKDKNGKPIISYIDQFPEPKNMEQGLFLQRLSDCLEESKNKIELPLPVGSTIFSNNYFWLHGRKPFKENTNLSRELLRIRGTFFY
ncbi:glutarate dioxygenase GlaH [Candidatus Pelagibacter bacterium]|nr:glutarate dioxygenase GlaH [Candidatus Pelagibacter bacterium]MDA8772543.1 glutarate dioxygenase GlaH [Candidatus Pelagibacter bacterium]